jgi:hypothetical protein
MTMAIKSAEPDHLLAIVDGDKELHQRLLDAAQQSRTSSRRRRTTPHSSDVPRRPLLGDASRDVDPGYPSTDSGGVERAGNAVYAFLVG